MPIFKLNNFLLDVIVNMIKNTYLKRQKVSSIRFVMKTNLFGPTYFFSNVYCCTHEPSSTLIPHTLLHLYI
jgi:hypothetical protein